jgi:hypothetical protein
MKAIVRQLQVETWWVKLYLAGPIDEAKNIIRKECYDAGLCVTIEPTDFIYTGGEEKGYVVGLINYPRFPSTKADINARAEDLMNKLLQGTFQHSALMMTPEETSWVTTRQGN